MDAFGEERMSGQIMSASREREDESAIGERGAFAGEVQRTRSRSWADEDRKQERVARGKRGQHQQSRKSSSK